MRRLFKLYPNKTRRALEILVPSSSWMLITLPFWLSFWHPAMVAYVIITFDVYWFYKSLALVVHSLRSFVNLTAHTAVDWKKLAQVLPNWGKLHHIVIIPEYKEPIHILRRTLENLAHQDFPKERLIIVLATEDKDSNARKVAGQLKSDFGAGFGHFLITRHVLHYGEIAGKSSNMAHAAKSIVGYLQKKKIPINFTTVTSCDADALLHPKYFSCLSYKFLTDPNRKFHLWQGAILFHNNIWRIPLPNRFLNTLNSIWNLAILSQKNRLINFSTYSLPYATAAKVGFWSVDVIPEDYHMFFKIYFELGDKVHVEPIFLPILVDAAESRGFFPTFINQYEQAKRWAWGVADIPYVIRGAVLHTEISLIDRVKRLLILMEHHIFWPANWFLLTIGSTIPPLINPLFGRTVLGHNLARISSSILTLSTIFLIVVFMIDWRIKPPRPQNYPRWKLPLLYLQWITLPVISFFLSALPGLDAHTRLLLGKRLEYRVTEKI
ncbi:glycosyltransferase family 2 protein [Patescibacteria group bacterium]|nr:glycosyltransferase family 2 protein [Patescibacteria group bacterium]MBU1473094.1 glycosyltransferase family 2 protein [Patescibacteria group bacterium]MBU2459631.1 glycosyltransferase family 2 protein [Patescibacteria group bacterium]MBU2544466.1 glycosyltransferase family 2 protein [Patescibacteria group bacterium]